MDRECLTSLRHRFTVGQYHRMAEAGIIAEDDRVELIEGEIFEVTPISSQHAACVKRLNKLFAHHVGERALVSVQDPVLLGEHSEPQPDLALLRPRPDAYASGHPGPHDVLLVVEVAEASLPYDRTVKIPLYGRAGIPEVWLVNLPGDAVEVHRKPTPRGYEDVRHVRRGGTLAPGELPDMILDVKDILGA